MEITCHHCKNTWEVPSGKMLAARLKLALGQKELHFICLNCGTKTVLTDEEFRSYDRPQNVVPVTATQARTGHSLENSSGMDETAGEAPTNPVEAPKPGKNARQAVVRVRGVDARRDHSDWAEVMGAFSRGEKITIVDTWTDGEATWVQLGPERWIKLEQDGEPVIELTD